MVLEVLGHAAKAEASAPAAADDGGLSAVECGGDCLNRRHRSHGEEDEQEEGREELHRPPPATAAAVGEEVQPAASGQQFFVVGHSCAELWRQSNPSAFFPLPLISSICRWLLWRNGGA